MKKHKENLLHRIKKKKGQFTWAFMIFFGLLALNCLPVSAFAAGGEEQSARLTQPHSHDMSVECGNENPLTYIPLTGDEDGRLYINGTEAETKTESVERYILPEGSYYLSENITLNQGIYIPENATVNLCLNGKTLQLEDKIAEYGTLCMSDCGEAGTITNELHVVSLYGNAQFIMYGGCLYATSEDESYMRYVIYMSSSSGKDTRVEINGGTIKSNKGDYGINGSGELQISGNPKFVGNECDIANDIVLNLKALNMDAGKKIKVSTENPLLSIGKSQEAEYINFLDGVDYSPFLITQMDGQYYSYEGGQVYINVAGITGQPTPEKISVNAVPAEGASYQWYQVEEQDVTKDRTIENMNMEGYDLTMFTLQAGDTVYVSSQETLEEAVVVLGSSEGGDFVEMKPFGERRYKGTVKSDGVFLIMYESSSGGGFLEVEEESIRVVRITQGEAVSNQNTNTLTKAATGRYMCKVTWDDLGYSVNSETVELHGHTVCGEVCTHDTPHEGIFYTAISTEDELLAAAADGGNYYLANDIEVIGTGTHDYSNAVVKVKNDFQLCLNGHTCSIKITSRNNAYCAMSVDDSEDFTMCDCSTGKTGKLVNDTFQEGEAASKDAATVIVDQSSGNLTLYGGTITNHESGRLIHVASSSGNVVFDGVTMLGTSAVSSTSGKKIIVKNGIIGMAGGGSNVITATRLEVQGGTINGWIEFLQNCEAVLTGGTINGYLDFASDAAAEVGGNVKINPITANNQDYGIKASSENVKIYLYGTPQFTGSASSNTIFCKPADTAGTASVIPHSMDGTKSYTGTSQISLYFDTNTAQVGQYLVQDLPESVSSDKFRLSNPGGFVLKQVDDNKNLILDKTIAVNEINFPDENFRKFVSENYDSDKDGMLYESDVVQITSMDVSGKAVSNLKGIEYFTGLTSLDCSGNSLAALDLSKNTELTELDASKNIVSINADTEYDLSTLPGMDVTKVSNVEGAELSEGSKLINFGDEGVITITYDVGNENVTAPSFVLEYKHSYGDWTITAEPTETTEGTAERICSICGDKEVKTDVPNLQDSVWIKGDYVAPTKDTNGSQSYTSEEYGTVTVVIPALGIPEEDKVAEAKKVVEEALNSYTATNSTTKENIQSVIDQALSEAGITDVTVTVEDLTKAEATENAAGSVGGNITITKGSVSDSVTINKTIAKLPNTDADRVETAKKVVEEALNSYTATNDTTKENIQSVVDQAISKAGITDVTAAVGDLTKAEATENAAGSVSGSISITKGSVSDSVTINKTIDKLPAQDTPEKPDTPEVTEAEQEKNALSLNAKLKVSQTGKKINIEWGKVAGADGYDVYVQYCGMKFTEKSITAIKSSKTTKVTVKKVNGKSLNLKKNYKIYVLAYKLVDDKKVTLGKTVTAHIVGRKNTQYTNVKAVKVKKSSYSLKKGKTAKIKASTVLVSPGKKQLTSAHAKQFRYASTDKKVATVSKQGLIKAVGKGTCTVYVYARNGYAKKITVKVQ